MEENNKLALIVAFYLSKYDKKALNSLGYNKFKEAFEDIGNKLNVKSNTIKNMRDEFDPFHSNNRKGWYQRELRPSRYQVLESFNDLSEFSLKTIVDEILNKNSNELDIIKNKEIYVKTLESNEEKENRPKLNFTNRLNTGKKAENIFAEYFSNGGCKEFKGDLIDTTNNGCGYDFELNSSLKYVFEVKGSSEECKNVLFTDKEWEVASQLGNKYILVLVSYVNSNSKIKLIKNPVKELKAKKRVYEKICIDWFVSI